MKKSITPPNGDERGSDLDAARGIISSIIAWAIIVGLLAFALWPIWGR